MTSETDIRSWRVDGKPGADVRYVFVGGLHRSGTSMVASALGSLDGAARLVDTDATEDEGHYLHGALPSACEFGGPGRFAFEPRLHAIASPDPARDRRLLIDGWEPYWSDPTAPVRVEKSPQNLIQTRWLDHVMPNSRFVIVTRHPASVALATQKWTRPGPPKVRRLMPQLSVESLIAHWIRAYHLFDQDHPFLGGRVDIVRFEDLFAADGRSAPRNGTRFDRLARWVGLEGTVEPPVRQSPANSYHGQWQRWLRSREGRRAATTWLPMAEAAMARWGYALEDQLL